MLWNKYTKAFRKLSIDWRLGTQMCMNVSYSYINFKKPYLEEMTVLHAKEILDGLCDSSVASKVLPSRLQSRKCMDVAGHEIRTLPRMVKTLSTKSFKMVLSCPCLWWSRIVPDNKTPDLSPFLRIVLLQFWEYCKTIIAPYSQNPPPEAHYHFVQALQLWMNTFPNQSLSGFPQICVRFSRWNYRGKLFSQFSS